MKRRLLDVLSEKATDGHFRAFSARELGERLGVGEDAVAGIVRGIRDEITKVLEAKGLVCGKDCVILSGGPGYRLAASISVGTASPTVRSTAEGTRRVTKPSVTDRPVTDDTDPHVTNVTDRVTDDLASPAELAEGPARQAWIVQQLSAGVKLSVDHVVRLFGCTRRTALRDLEALKRAGRIEYCGPARTGHYRLTKGQGR